MINSKFILLIALIFSGCTTRAPLIVTSVQQDDKGYYVIVNYRIGFYSEEVYQIGDTIK